MRARAQVARWRLMPRIQTLGSEFRRSPCLLRADLGSIMSDFPVRIQCPLVSMIVSRLLRSGRQQACQQHHGWRCKQTERKPKPRGFGHPAAGQCTVKGKDRDRKADACDDCDQDHIAQTNPRRQCLAGQGSSAGHSGNDANRFANPERGQYCGCGRPRCREINAALQAANAFGDHVTLRPDRRDTALTSP